MKSRCRSRGRGRYSFGGGVPRAAFYAPLRYSLLLNSGAGGPTFSRTTKAWEFDNEGKLIEIPSGAARFVGARCVFNKVIGHSEDLTDAGWTKQNVTITSDDSIAPDGTMGMDKVVCSAVSGQHYIYSTTSTVLAGEIYTCSYYVKKADFDYVQIAFLSGQVSGNPRANFNINSGSLETVDAGLSANITPESNGTFRISVTCTSATTSLHPILVAITTGSASRLPSFAGDGVAGTHVWGGQTEKVSGQADQTPSEYVSVGVVSSPFHGGGIDGIKYFSTNKDGTQIPTASLTGYHAEGARSNNLPYSNDLTNAAWVKTNTTAALDAVGLDNVQNSASTVTSTASDGTIIQTITFASSARSSSAYVRRKTGTGTISITRDGGSSWTDVTSQLNTTTYTRVKIENTSVLNPGIGFKISTSGDAIEVYGCQDEAGPYIRTLVLTTTTAVTRNADNLNYDAAVNFSDTAGTAKITQRLDNAGTTGTIYAISLSNSITPIYKGSAGASVGTADGTLTHFGAAWTTDTLAHKAAGNWAVGSRRVCLDGGAVSGVTSYDGSFDATGIYIGYTPVSLVYLFGTVTDVKIWDVALTDTELQEVTQ
jgi:hypothetical protein